jgi:hypothetical protein
LIAFGNVFEGYRFAGVARESKALTSQRTPKGERFMECSDLSELWILAGAIDGVWLRF